MGRVLTRLVMIAILISFSATVVYSQGEDPKQKLMQIQEEMKVVTADMAKASEAKDNAKYQELAVKYEELKQQLIEQKNLVDAKAADANKSALAKKAYNDGGSQMRSGNFAAAVEQYKRCLEIEPDNAGAYYNMGVAYLRLKNSEEAKSAFLKAVEINANYAAAYLVLGNIESRARENATALKHYQRAIELDPKMAKAYYGMGNIHFRDSNFAQAVASYKKAVEVDPKFEDAWVVLGRSYNGLKQNSNALSAYDKAIQIDAKSDAHYYRAEVLNKLERYSEALSSAEKSLKYRKRDKAPVYFEKGLSLAKLGRKAEAIASFEEAKTDRAWRESAQYQIDVLNGKIKPTQ